MARDKVSKVVKTLGGPLYIKLCLSESAFLNYMRVVLKKKTGIPEHWVTGTADACTRTYISDSGLRIAVVCMYPDLPYSEQEIAALLVHEAVHIAQFVFDDVGELEPSRELQAYTIQDITRALFMSYVEAHDEE